MKKKTYKHGKDIYRLAMKPVGRGMEVVLTCGKKTLFVGNFIHSEEAQSWYLVMDREISRFANKYWITSKAPRAFYQKFLVNHLYKVYYDHVDRWLSKHNRSFKHAFKRDERKYMQLKRQWDHTDRTYFRKSA